MAAPVAAPVTPTAPQAIAQLEPDPPPPPPRARPGSPQLERWRAEVLRYAVRHGVRLDELRAFQDYVLAIIEVESRGDPNAIGDDGHSVGLFQLHDAGEGYGMSVAQRQDARVQMDTMVPKILRAFREGRARGLSGARLAVHTARRAQRPLKSTLPRYGAAYARLSGETADLTP